MMAEKRHHQTATADAEDMRETIKGHIREEKPMTETPHNPAADRPLVAAAAVKGA